MMSLVWKADVEGVQVSLSCHPWGRGSKQDDATVVPYFNYSGAGCDGDILLSVYFSYSFDLYVILELI